MDFTSSVLAKPGAPVIKQCPPANKAIRICSIICFWPTMTLASSVSIRARPAMSCSTSSCSEVCILVGHGVKNNIDAEGIRLFLRELTKIIFVLAFAFPAIAEVGIVANDDHHPAFVVEDSLIMRLLGVRRLPRNA